MISEPLLAFGGRHEHVDPKTGLGLYGPYSLLGQRRPPLTSIIAGMVGPASMLADAERWLEACRGILTNDESEPFLYPHFPGMNADHPFQCELTFGDTWRESIRTNNLQGALATANFYERIKRVVGLYVRGIETLAQREPRPSVVFCCIPQEVIDLCTVKVTGTGELSRAKIGTTERRAERVAETGQLFLFPDMDPRLGIEDEEGGHRNLRRGLKAEAMQFGIPTQLVWPRSLLSSDVGGAPHGRQSQDIATRAWNLTTAVYHKAGGSPWRLAEVEPGVCFVGVSFYREIGEKDPFIRTSMAQAFTAAAKVWPEKGGG